MEYLRYKDLPLIQYEDDDYSPKYDNLSEFVIDNFDKLKNHQIDIDDIPELCEHLVDEIIYELVDDFFKEHIEKLYRYLFQYIYYKETQTYYLKDMISFETLMLENQINKLKNINLFNETVKNTILQIGNNIIDNNNQYLKLWGKIEPTFIFPNIKEIYENYNTILEIIRDYAYEESLVKEFSEWKPVNIEGEEYNEW